MASQPQISLSGSYVYDYSSASDIVPTVGSVLVLFEVFVEELVVPFIVVLFVVEFVDVLFLGGGAFGFPWPLGPPWPFGGGGPP